jgi:hypothetical protein
MEKIKYLIYPFLIVAGLCVISCTKEDDYKKFTKDGEITYPGKPSNVIAQAGNKRVLLRVVLSSDPAITKIKTYWNSRADSLETPVVRSNGDTVNVFITQHLNEGVNNFEVFTYNNGGNKSIVSNVSGTMFSDNYLSTVPTTNRAINTLLLSAYDKITINWGTALTSEQRIEIKYTDVTGAAKTLVVPSQPTTVLPNYKSGTAITYRSIYAPEATAYDVLSVAPSTVDLTKGTYLADYAGYLYQPGTASKGLGASKTWTPSGTNGIIITMADMAATYKALIVVNPNNTLTITAAPGSTSAPYTMFTSGLPAPYVASWANSAACNNTYDPATKTYRVRYGYGSAGSYRVSEEVIVLY